MSITIGSWIVPVIVTAIAFTLAYYASDKKPSADYGNIGKAVGNALIYAVALIVSLIAWFFWALIT